jgi:hypothetical protein
MILRPLPDRSKLEPSIWNRIQLRFTSKIEFSE